MLRQKRSSNLRQWNHELAKTLRKTPKLPDGQRVLWREEVGSTNRVALDLAEAGEPSGLWMVADRQTLGRGRAKRVWISEPGNLFASYLTSFSSPGYELHGLPLVAGLALHDAVEKIFDEASTSFPLGLKWPNDLTCYGAKIGGILIETTSSPDANSYPVVIGFGLNLKSAPMVPDQATTSVVAQGVDVILEHALEFLGESLQHWLNVWQAGSNIDAVCAAWMERGIPLGSRLKVRGRSGAPVEGRFAGLNKEGALLLDRAGEIMTVTFGDVDMLN